MTTNKLEQVSHESARKALDSLDDFARMDIGVNAIGPRGVLERYIAQQSALASAPAGEAVYQMKCDDYWVDLTPSQYADYDAEKRILYPTPAADASEGEVTMEDAIAAGDGTLHGAIDYWQERALKAERRLAISAQPGDAGMDRLGDIRKGVTIHSDPSILMQNAAPPQPDGKVECDDADCGCHMEHDFDNVRRGAVITPQPERPASKGWNKK